MDYQEKLAFLRSYRWSLARERDLLNQIEEIKARAARTTQALSGMPGAPGGPSGLARAVEALIDAQQSLCAQIEASCAARRRVEAALCTVRDPRQQTILRLHYISGKTFEQIAVELHYSYRQILREYRRGMDVIECHMETE